MKIEIDDRPPQNSNLARQNGTTTIRIIPETNQEMAVLEQCLTVKVKFGEFRKWALPDQVSYGFFGDYGI